MYNNSCMLSSYTNNCSQHQWVLNLMRFIIIEIEHTNLVGVQGTESFGNGEFRERRVSSRHILWITSFPYHTPRKRRSTRLEKPH